jgi:hypothetical protein
MKQTGDFEVPQPFIVYEDRYENLKKKEKKKTLSSSSFGYWRAGRLVGRFRHLFLKWPFVSDF